MRKLLSFILIVGLFTVSCGRNSSSSDNNSFEQSFNDENLEQEKSPEELREELKGRELLEPLTYVSSNEVTLTPQRIKTRSAGLFRDAEYEDDGALIEGYFKNSATLAKFKDVEVKINFYSQTETLIDEETYIVYEYVDPNSKKYFSIKIPEIPQAYDSFTFDVVGATAVIE